jgi:hypothetical protein
MFQLLRLAYSNPYPVRAAIRRLIRFLKLGSYQNRVRIGAVPRPQYAFCVFHAALLAKRLGYRRISAIEFGVAGGNGLLALEYHAREVSRCLGVDVEVYGFDTGSGLPRPSDYRDMPYIWCKAFFEMNVQQLKSRLTLAKLVLGDVAATVPTFIERFNPAPIGAVMIDVDYYSSTVAALKLFEIGDNSLLPRIYCYFDDVIFDPISAFNDYTGERLAIREFNDSNIDRKIALPYINGYIDEWIQQIWVFHSFTHSRYNDFVRADEASQLPLSERLFRR